MDDLGCIACAFAEHLINNIASDSEIIASTLLFCNFAGVQSPGEQCCWYHFEPGLKGFIDDIKREYCWQSEF